MHLEWNDVYGTFDQVPDPGDPPLWQQGGALMPPEQAAAQTGYAGAPNDPRWAAYMDALYGPGSSVRGMPRETPDDLMTKITGAIPAVSLAMLMGNAAMGAYGGAGAAAAPAADTNLGAGLKAYNGFGSTVGGFDWGAGAGGGGLSVPTAPGYSEALSLGGTGASDFGTGLSGGGGWMMSPAGEITWAPAGAETGGSGGDVASKLGTAAAVKSLASGTRLSRLLGAAGIGQTGQDLASLLGPLAGAGLGMYGANQQANSLADLARQSMEAEKTRYQDLVGRESARYEDIKAREDARLAIQQKAIQEAQAVGAPSRDRYEASFSPTFDVNSVIPQSALDTTTSSLARAMSVRGNPYGNPGSLAEIQKNTVGNLVLPQLNTYRSQNATTGGYGSFGGAGATIPGISTNLPATATAGSNVGYTAGNAAQTGAIGAQGGGLNALGYGIDQVFNPQDNTLAALLKKLSGGGNNIFSVQ